MLRSYFRITMPLLGFFLFGFCLTSKCNGQPLTTAQMQHIPKANARLRFLWQQRGQRKVARLVLPFASDPVARVQYDAIRMLGRLEDPVALPTLQELAKRSPYTMPLDSEPSEGLLGTYPILQLAIGRIRSRKLSGQRKIEGTIKELGLTFPALIRLSARVNRDQYARFRPGNAVLLEVADILYQQKKRGVAVDSLAGSLTLPPAQRFLLSVTALPAPQQSKRILTYLARPPVQGEDRRDVLEYWENLSHAARGGTLPFVQSALQRRSPPTSVYGLIPVLHLLARDGDKKAFLLLASLKEDRDEKVRWIAQYYLRQLRME